jgi:hypothetical protein
MQSLLVVNTVKTVSWVQPRQSTVSIRSLALVCSSEQQHPGAVQTSAVVGRLNHASNSLVLCVSQGGHIAGSIPDSFPNCLKRRV